MELQLQYLGLPHLLGLKRRCMNDSQGCLYVSRTWECLCPLSGQRSGRSSEGHFQGIWHCAVQICHWFKVDVDDPPNQLSIQICQGAFALISAPLSFLLQRHLVKCNISALLHLHSHLRNGKGWLFYCPHWSYLLPLNAVWLCWVWFVPFRLSKAGDGHHVCCSRNGNSLFNLFDSLGGWFFIHYKILKAIRDTEEKRGFLCFI